MKLYFSKMTHLRSLSAYVFCVFQQLISIQFGFYLYSQTLLKKAKSRP